MSFEHADAPPTAWPSHARRAHWLAPALVGWVLGCALQLQQSELFSLWVYGLCAGFALLGCVGLALQLQAIGLGRLLALGLAACLGFGVTGWRAVDQASDSLPPALEGVDLRVVGVVAAMPQRQDHATRFRLQVEQAWHAGQAVVLPPALYLGWYGGYEWRDGSPELQRVPADLKPGERWAMTVRLKAPHGGLNPHGFDFELWMWEQGLQATGYVRVGPQDTPPKRMGQTWRYPVEQWRHAVRESIFSRLGRGDDDVLARWSGVVAALVVGDQRAIDRADWDLFRATGIAHLMSISGLHITLFAWLAVGLIGRMWRLSPSLCLRCPAPYAAWIGGVLLALGYAVFSGWGVPAQRTTWMLLTVVGLRLLGRTWPWTMVWLVACAVVVAVDPWALLQPGFWLSFVAVGLLFAADSRQRAPTAPGLRGKVLRQAVAMLREQWVITLSLTPLTLLLFSQVSLVGLLANALAIPWVTGLVTPLALLGMALPPLWDMAAWALQALGGLLQVLASWPWATWSVPQAPWWAAAAGLMGGALLVLPLPWSLRAVGLPLLLPVLLWQPPKPAPGEFELLAADIGQGNAVLVQTARHALLYDAGPRYSRETDAGHRVIVPLLQSLGVRLHTLVLSHRDSDHTGGAQAVLGQHTGARLLSSMEDSHPLLQQFPGEPCVAGQAWQWDGVRFEILHPDTATGSRTDLRPNARSCVLRISNGQHSALLAGDIEQPQEAQLIARQIAQGAPLQADLLLVPHHGSKTSSSAEFLDAVRPSIAWVQAGYRNRFGHPAAPVMARYQERQIRVFESARCGAAAWSSTAPGQVRCQRQAAQRYWHHRVPNVP